MAGQNTHETLTVKFSLKKINSRLVRLNRCNTSISHERNDTMPFPNKNIIFTLLAGSYTSLVLSSCSPSNSDGIQTAPDSNDSESTTSQDSGYTDGVYKATGEYGNQPSFITVTVNLEDDKIAEVEVAPHATNPTSLDLQERFAEAVPAVVVGKNIDEVNVGRLAGSSGTPNGFNDAIRQIKQQAETEETPTD